MNVLPLLRTVQTTDHIPDGRTIILGSVTQGKTGKELVVMVRPHIVRSEAAKETR